MVTIYDLLEVNEDASKEEIEQSYQNLVIEYQTNPINTPEENKQNEMILNKLRMGYEILMNDEKRKKYDKDLAKKRAEDLIKNIPEKNNNKSEEEHTSLNIENKTQNNELDKKRVIEKNLDSEYDEIPKAKNTRNKEQQDDEVELTKEEQKKIRKAAQKEFNENLKRVQKAEEEYNNAYNEAYRKYMKKMGYEAKEPWTIKRIRNLLISILVIILVCAIAWIIPPIRKVLIDAYESNIVIKSLVDVVRALIKAIASIFE